MAETPERQVAERICAAISRGDVDLALAQFSPDATLHVDGFAPGGLAAARRWLEALTVAFPDAYAQVLEAPRGSTGPFPIAFGGTQREPFATPFGTVPSSGRSVSLRETVTLEVEGGRVVTLHTTLDRLAFVYQLGLVPQPRPG
ncbi:MAG: nuclear transport factor 2 family protein [Thermoleophilia bacterium]